MRSLSPLGRLVESSPGRRTFEIGFKSRQARKRGQKQQIKKGSGLPCGRESRLDAASRISPTSHRLRPLDSFSEIFRVIVAFFFPKCFFFSPALRLNSFSPYATSPPPLFIFRERVPTRALSTSLSLHSFSPVFDPIFSRFRAPFPLVFFPFRSYLFLFPKLFHLRYFSARI